MPTYKFGLRQALIAKWNGPNSYGTVYALNAVNNAEIQLETTNAQLEGDDIIADTHAMPINLSVTIEFGAGAQTMEVLSTLTGQNITSSGSDRYIKFGDGNFPYIGICMRVLETSGGGDNVLTVYKAKLNTGFSYSARYGGYVVPRIELMGVDDGTNGFFRIFERTTTAPLTSILI
jgi:hypothetical protein